MFGGRYTRSRSAGLVLAAAAVCVVGTSAPAWGQQGSGLTAAQGADEPHITNEITLRLEPDGVVQAREEIVFEAGAPEEFNRTFILREYYDEDHDRIYRLDGVGAVTEDETPLRTEISETEDTATVHITTTTAAGADGEGDGEGDGGAATVILTYEIQGTTSDIGGGIEFAWYAVGGYSAPVAETVVVVDSEVPPLGLSCAAGDPRSSIYCTSSDMGGYVGLFARFTQAQLAPGETLRIAVSFPSDAAKEELILERRFAFTSAFAVNRVTMGVFSAVVLTLVGGLIALIYARGRDERAQRKEWARGGGRLFVDMADAPRFRPPDDVLPGQIGTLIDEQADVVDVTATVVDLAVRGYLDIEELPHSQFAAVDWRLRQLPVPDDDPLRNYERLLLDALFDGRGEVRISELGGDLAAALPEVRAELYQDMVRLRWFSRRPNVVRNRWTTAGIAITIVGVVLTAVLAVFTKAAFTGLSVIIVGAAIAVGAQYMPTKTKRGSEVLAHTLGFRAYLGRADAHEIPESQRVAVFSRYLPYAIIFDKVDKWARILAAAGAQELEYDDLPWYHAPAEWRLEDFTDSIKAFTLTLSGAISNTRPFRVPN